MASIKNVIAQISTNPDSNSLGRAIVALLEQTESRVEIYRVTRSYVAGSPEKTIDYLFRAKAHKSIHLDKFIKILEEMKRYGLITHYYFLS